MIWRPLLPRLVSRGIIDDVQDPTIAVLVVEVSDTTLTLDRTQKAQLYARHSIPEYWILILVDDCLEAYRDPDPASETYQTKLTLHRGDTITPPVRIQYSGILRRA